MVKKRMLKIWNLSDMIFDNYREYIDSGFQADDRSGVKRPRAIHIEESKTEAQVVNAADISTCGTIVGVVKSRTEVLVLECFPSFATEEEREAKGKTLKVKLHGNASFIQDIFFY